MVSPPFSSALPPKLSEPSVTTMCSSLRSAAVEKSPPVTVMTKFPTSRSITTFSPGCGTTPPLQLAGFPQRPSASRIQVRADVTGSSVIVTVAVCVPGAPKS